MRTRWTSTRPERKREDSSLDPRKSDQTATVARQRINQNFRVRATRIIRSRRCKFGTKEPGYTDQQHSKNSRRHCYLLPMNVNDKDRVTSRVIDDERRELLERLQDWLETPMLVLGSASSARSTVGCARWVRR